MENVIYLYFTIVFYYTGLLSHLKILINNLADVLSPESVVLASQISEKEREKMQKGTNRKILYISFGCSKGPFH